MAHDAWNRCDVCGQFISHQDIADGKALRQMIEPDSELGVETWATLCQNHMPLPDPLKDAGKHRDAVG